MDAIRVIESAMEAETDIRKRDEMLNALRKTLKRQESYLPFEPTEKEMLRDEWLQRLENKRP